MEATLASQTSVVMFLNSLSNLPAWSLPPGYEMRSLQPGDEQAWEQIIAASFGEQYHFKEFMEKEDQYEPEKVWFVVHNHRPVATASAWHINKYPEDTGCLHMVGILPEHAGKGLGKQVSLAALHKMKQEGRSKAMLNTNTFRLPAIKTYLNIGFTPHIIDDEHVERWRTAAEQLKDERLLRFLKKWE